VDGVDVAPTAPHSLSFLSLKVFLGVFFPQNARIFVGMSRNSNLVFDQIKGIIHDKLDLIETFQQLMKTLGSKELER
jgi:hypothetical protein